MIIVLDTAIVRSNNFPCVTQINSAVTAEPRQPGWRIRSPRLTARSTRMRIALLKCVRSRLAWIVILSAGWNLTGFQLPCRAARGQEPTMVLYTPAKEDFLPEYERDQANNKIQSWKQYWGWVQDFYKGNLLADGWTRHSARTLAAVKSDENRQTLTEQFNALGRLVSREWAKVDDVRKITTADLRRWNKALTEAVRVDDGSGEKIKKALGQVREQAEKQLGALPRAGGVAIRGLAGASAPC
jgi:hypothetical protein